MTNRVAARVVGLGAAPGRTTGTVHLVREDSLGSGVSRDTILVTRVLHPHLAPLLARVAGIVVEEGSLLQHATTLAREFGVPAIVGVRGAMDLFRTGDVIEMDGGTGVMLITQPAP